VWIWILKSKRWSQGVKPAGSLQQINQEPSSLSRRPQSHGRKSGSISSPSTTNISSLNNTLAIKLKSNFTRYGCPTSSEASKKFASMWEFERLTSCPGNPKANAKSESIRNSKNLLGKVLDNRVPAHGNSGAIEMHRGIMARCCQPFVHSTAACDTAVNRGIRFHVETLHIIPFEACSYLLYIRDLPSRTMLPSRAFSCSLSGQSPFPSWFSRCFGLLVTTAGCGIVIGHSSVPFLVCLVTLPNITRWMVIAVAARDTGIWRECPFAWTNPAGRPAAAQLGSLMIPLLGRLQVFACLLGLFLTMVPHYRSLSR